MRALAFVCIVAFCACRASEPESANPAAQPPKTSEWLAAANEAAKWLAQNAIDTEHGLAWRADPNSKLEVDRTLYAGSPGVVLFFLELAHATGDVDALAFARGGVEDLLANLPEHVEGESAGLYTGVAGVGYTIGEAWLATNDERYRLGLGSCFATLVDSSRADNNRAVWGDCNDVISGSAGTGFFLLWLHEREAELHALSLNAWVGGLLASQAGQGESNFDWPMDSTFPRRMPNFSHGTAGIAAFLTRGCIADSAPQLLGYPIRGAEHLIAIADRSNGGFLVGHDTPDNPTLMYMGWCHGPCGTARLFRELFVATKQERWRELELACAKSVMTSGLPEQRLPGFWNNVGRCCGDAGVIEFMLDLYVETQDVQYLDFARRVARNVLARATRDEHGMRWIQAENRTRPDVLVAQTGLMQGAAGIGLALVHLDEIERGLSRSIRLPDEPPP